MAEEPGREVIKVSDDYVSDRRVRTAYAIDGFTAVLVDEQVEDLDEDATVETEDPGSLPPPC